MVYPSKRRGEVSKDRDMANSVVARPAGYTGIEVHGQTIRVGFMYKGVRHRHTLGIEPTKANLKHAAGLRSAALFALKSDNYVEADYFPNSRPAETAPQTSMRLGDLCDRYKPLKAVDITEETQSRYENALNVCLKTIDRDRPINTLLPADILAIARRSHRHTRSFNHQSLPHHFLQLSVLVREQRLLQGTWQALHSVHQKRQRP